MQYRYALRPSSLSPHILLSLCLSACSSSSADAPDQPPSYANAAGSGNGSAGAKASDDKPGSFPAPLAGYTRIVAPTLKNLPAGADTTVCQYVQAPLDRDIDVLDVGGYQSLGGHHAVAFASTDNVAVGTTRACGDEDALSQGAFLGGVGGEAGGGVVLPPGVAFRMRKGSSIMLNTHFINPTDHSIDGESVVDFKFVEADESRTIASMFVNGSGSFQVAPHAPGEAIATCKLAKSMQFILFTNHMHEHGTSAITEIMRADGSMELAHEDPTWTYEMQFKAVYDQWPLSAPLSVAAGDTVRTRCSWRNEGDQPLQFPREMCFGVGFFLSDGKSSPVCLDGLMIER